MIPRATARLQLHAGFTLDDAAAQLPYYAGLGISHLYLSPVTMACPGSTHGYDVVDHGAINSELGGMPALRRLAAAARQHRMGLIADIVPNHMAAHGANPWWHDVLARGPGSAYAHWFDIDWQSADPALHGKVLLPQLGRPYGASLRAGDIQLVCDPARAEFYIDAAGARLPLAPGTQPARSAPGQARDSHDPATDAGRARLHQLLQAQHYRLAWWRTAADQINWRRFFEISTLVGVRVEEPQVFHAVHALILQLYADGLIDGVRVDHVDGLADPIAYCRQLRAALRECGEARLAEDLPREPYLVVEKILGPDETLDERWDVDGTTGYDFMDQAGAVMHDPAAGPVLLQAWQVLAGDSRPVREQLESVRWRMLTRHFAAERRALSRTLLHLARLDPDTRDWSEEAIDRVLARWLAAFPVYRSYFGPLGGAATDLAHCQSAASRARAVARPAWTRADDDLLDQIIRWLTEPGPHPVQHQALRRFQQLTPPLAAKALEDTLFYRHGPLLSRNEVGAAPGQFGLPTAEFHTACAARARRFPAAMLATATHDHKRGEDVRARLAVLSEIPLEWLRQVHEWLGSPGKPPTAGDRCMLMQTLVGAWPLALQPRDSAGVSAFVERARAWQQKALREAKLHSSWEEPNAGYEAASDAYLEYLAGGPMLSQIAAFAMHIAPAGLLNSLAQATLRMTVPGVPDLYQGTEFWDFSLVDPDNRQAVDYPARHAALARLAPQDQPAALPPLSPGGPLPPQWTAGHVKQQVVQRLLHLRASYPLLFDHGSYLPVSVHGPRAAHLLAFVRNHEDLQVLVLVPRLCAMQLAGHTAQQASAFWSGTRLRLPAGMARLPWRDIFTHDVQRPDAHGCLDVAQLLEGGPVSVRLA